MLIRKTFHSFDAIKFKESNTKMFIKLFVWIFIKGPHLLGVIANIKQRGGLLVATTKP